MYLILVVTYLKMLSSPNSVQPDGALWHVLFSLLLKLVLTAGLPCQLPSKRFLVLQTLSSQKDNTRFFVKTPAEYCRVVYMSICMYEAYTVLHMLTSKHTS